MHDADARGKAARELNGFTQGPIRRVAAIHGDENVLVHRASICDTADRARTILAARADCANTQECLSYGAPQWKMSGFSAPSTYRIPPRPRSERDSAWSTIEYAPGTCVLNSATTASPGGTEIVWMPPSGCAKSPP